MATNFLPKKNLDKFYLKPRFLAILGSFVAFSTLVALSAYFLLNQNQQNSQAAKLILPLETSARQMYPGETQEFNFKYANLGNDGEILQASIIIIVNDKLEIQTNSLKDKFGKDENSYCVNKDLVEGQKISYTPRSSSTVLNSLNCNGNKGGQNVSLPPITEIDSQREENWPADKYGVFSFKLKAKSNVETNQILNEGLKIDFILNTSNKTFTRKIQIVEKPKLSNNCKANEYYENGGCKSCPDTSISKAGSISLNQCVCLSPAVLLNSTCQAPNGNLSSSSNSSLTPLCTNLATNYPGCNKCGENKDFIDNTCQTKPKQCLNGAADSPKCLDCGKSKFLSIFGCIDNSAVLSEVKGVIDISKDSSLELRTATSSSFKVITAKDVFTENLNMQILKLKKDTINQNNLEQSQKLVADYLFNVNSNSTTGAVKKFQKPIELQFQYDKNELSLYNENNLKIQKWDGQNWSVLTGCIADLQATNLKCQSDSVGLFALTADLR